MQEKTKQLASTAEKTGLKINNTKTKVIKINIVSKEPIMLGGTNIEDISQILCTFVKNDHTDGDSMAQVLARISKATEAYAALQNIW